MSFSQLTLKRMYQHVFLKNRDKTALVFEKQTVTYGELLKAANRVANALRRRGVTANTRVALLMSNCIEYVMCDMGIIQAGAAKVPLNDMLGEKEILHILKHSNARVLIVDSNFYELIDRNKMELPELETIVAVGSEGEHPHYFISWNEFQSSEPEDDVGEIGSQQDIAVIMYTGGTTGLPKGVVHTKENMSVNLLSHIMELCLNDDENILLTTPLPHSAGFVLAAGLAKGATHFIEKKFDPQAVLNHLEQNQITLTFMVPTMIYRVIDSIGERRPNFSHLRTILYGAAPITVERLKQGLEIFGPVFTQLFGQSEAPNFITRLRKSDHSLEPAKEKRLGSCGQPVLMAEVKIVDHNGKELPRGTVGEIIAKTPYTMIGYHQAEDKTAETLKEGWLYTGDIGMMDEEGYVYLLDRKKDIIITGGLNVYTSEVENVIQQYQGVRQVAVIGIPDPDWGEAVSAFIVPDPNASLTEEEIQAFCSQQLAKYKRPKKFIFTEELPLTPYGKINKKALRQPYWEKSGRNIH